jgi:excisionase family DNA binding protein
MKTRPTQFGVRENTASLRQHASRLAVSSSSPQSPTVVELLQEEATASASGMGHVEVLDLPLTEANGATAGEERDGKHLLTVDEVAARLCVSRNWVYNHASEIGAYRLGKYWRFSWSRVLERLGR